jgi:hypothetical protein
MSDPACRKSAATTAVPPHSSVQSHPSSETPRAQPTTVTKATPEPELHSEAQEIAEEPRTGTETIVQPEAPDPIAPLQIDVSKQSLQYPKRPAYQVPEMLDLIYRD